MEEVLVIASSCDEDRPIERIDASRRTPFSCRWRKLSIPFPLFHVFHDVQIQALLQSSEFLTLASQVGSLDEGEGRPFRSKSGRDVSRFGTLISILIHPNSSCHYAASFFFVASLLCCCYICCL